EAPGVVAGGQLHGVVIHAQGGGGAADLVPGAVIDMAHGPLHRVGQALHGGGHDGVGLAGLIHVHADDIAVIGGGGGGDGLEHGAAAGEHDLGAVGVPAADHGLQLGGGGEGITVLPGVVHVNGDALLSGSGVGALDVAVAEPAAGGVGAAAAAGEAQLGEAVLHGGVAGQVTGLLLLEGDAGHIGQNVAAFVAQGIAVHKDELGVGVGNGGAG